MTNVWKHTISDRVVKPTAPRPAPGTYPLGAFPKSVRGDIVGRM